MPLIRSQGNVANGVICSRRRELDKLVHIKPRRKGGDCSNEGCNTVKTLECRGQYRNDDLHDSPAASSAEVVCLGDIE